MPSPRVSRLLTPHSPHLGRVLAIVAPLLIGIAGASEHVTDSGVTLWSLCLPVAALVAWHTSLRRAGLVTLVGGALWVAVAAVVQPGVLGEPLWYVDRGLRLGVVLLAAALAAGWRRAVMRHQAMVRVDPMTGLLTAKEFARVLEGELARALRYERPFTVIYLSLEGARAPRADAQGIALVREIGHLIETTLRGPDAVAWMRGREYGVLMPETGPAAAGIALGRLQSALDEELEGRGLRLTVSIGAITWIRSELTVDQLVQRAYQMLYLAQQGADDGCRHEVLDTAEVLL